MTREELNSRVYSAMRAAEKKMNEQVAQFMNNSKNLCVEWHDYEPSLEDFLANLGEAKKEFEDIEFVSYKWDNERLHTDSVSFATDDDAERKVVRDFEILDAEEYNSSLYANCGEEAEYDGYVLVVVVDEYVVDDDNSTTGTPLQCMESIASQGASEHVVRNLHGKSRSYSVDVEDED